MVLHINLNLFFFLFLTLRSSLSSQSFALFGLVVVYVLANGVSFSQINQVDLVAIHHVNGDSSFRTLFVVLCFLHPIVVTCFHKPELIGISTLRLVVLLKAMSSKNFTLLELQYHFIAVGEEMLQEVMAPRDLLIDFMRSQPIEQRRDLEYGVHHFVEHVQN